MNYFLENHVGKLLAPIENKTKHILFKELKAKIPKSSNRYMTLLNTCENLLEKHNILKDFV